MANSTDYPRLLFRDELTERVLYEMELKGWADVSVEISQGYRYLLHFYDPVRLQQDIAYTLEELHKSCFAEPGMIVIPKVTPEAIRGCLQRVESIHFFDGLVPQRDDPDNWVLAQNA